MNRIDGGCDAGRSGFDHIDGQTEPEEQRKVILLKLQFSIYLVRTTGSGLRNDQLVSSLHLHLRAEVGDACADAQFIQDRDPVESADVYCHTGGRLVPDILVDIFGREANSKLVGQVAGITEANRYVTGIEHFT